MQGLGWRKSSPLRRIRERICFGMQMKNQRCGVDCETTRENESNVVSEPSLVLEDRCFSLVQINNILTCGSDALYNTT